MCAECRAITRFCNCPPLPGSKADLAIKKKADKLVKKIGRLINDIHVEAKNAPPPKWWNPPGNVGVPISEFAKPSVRKTMARNAKRLMRPK